MYVRVQGAAFKDKLLALIGNKSGACINFKLEGNRLLLQTTGLVNNESYVTVEEYKNTEPVEFSIVLDKTIALLNEDEDVCINSGKDTFEMYQNRFSILKQYDYQTRAKFIPAGGLKPFKSEQFSRFVKDSKALDGISKDLAEPLSNIEILNNFAVVQYSNTIYIDKLEADNFKISSETARQFSNALYRSKNPIYSISENKSLMTVQLKEDETLFIPVSKPDPITRAAIKDVVDSLKIITQIDISQYIEQLQIVCGEHKKLIVEMHIYEGALGFTFRVNGTTTFRLGATGKALCNMQLSIAQLFVIVKLFITAPQVILQRKDRLLCLKSSSSEKRLIISGTIY